MMRIVISGSPGVGKSSVIRELCSQCPDLHIAVSYTTRLPRPEESPGTDYHYTTTTDFLKLAETGNFIEYVLQRDTYYGTPWKEALQSPANSVIFDLNVNGGLVLKRAFPDTILIFLHAPQEEIEKRLRCREKDGRMSEDQIKSRLAMGQADFKMASKRYDYMVENHNISQCVDEILKILNMNEGGINIERRS